MIGSDDIRYICSFNSARDLFIDLHYKYMDRNMLYNVCSTCTCCNLERKLVAIILGRGNKHAKLGEQIDLAVTGEKIEPFNPRSIMINLNLLLE